LPWGVFSFHGGCVIEKFLLAPHFHSCYTQTKQIFKPQRQSFVLMHVYRRDSVLPDK
jgi:hypothetical protein